MKHPGFAPLQPQGTRPPLFWVDAGPLFLLTANRLGPNQPVLGLRIPTSEAARFHVPYKIEEGAGELVRYLRDLQPSGPYYLAGLCVAGITAYEMARQLLATGQRVALLAVFNVPGPDDRNTFYESRFSSARPKTKVELLLSELWQGGVTGFPRFAYRRSTAIARRLKLLRWRAQQAMGVEVNRNRLLNDPDAIENTASYFSIPRHYTGHVVFLQSDDWAGPNEAWRALLRGGFEVHRVSGGHLSMFDEQHVDSVVNCLQQCLARSQSRAA